MTIIQNVDRCGIVVELKNGRIAFRDSRRGKIDRGLRLPRATRFPVRGETSPEGGSGVAFIAKRYLFTGGGAVMSPVTS